MPPPACVLEPTCGEGAFLQASAAAFPDASLVGFDVSAAYVATARARLPLARAHVEVSDFFTTNWPEMMRRLPEPLLIVGNPPWVTSATQSTLNASNLPEKTNFQNHKGLDALTGKSNFDISEWMLLHLLQALANRRFCMAMLCKATVARRIMHQVATQSWPMHGEVRTIDTRLHFAAAVDAVLLLIKSGAPQPTTTRWPVYAALAALTPARHMGVINGQCYSDLDAYESTRTLAGTAHKQWRSGLKHDCAQVMELQGDAHTGLRNGLGEEVPAHDDYVFPLLKGSDLANGLLQARRHVIVPQRRLGEDTTTMKTRAPNLWAYLQSHEPRFLARKSRIYRNQPPFAIFGVGAYAFAPYKVAICGLYKKLVFTVVPPFAGKPVMVDDTAYFLPCDTAEEAEELARALASPRAKAFFEARVFWDAKRPVNKALLQSLAVQRLLKHGGA